MALQGNCWVNNLYIYLICDDIYIYIYIYIYMFIHIITPMTIPINLKWLKHCFFFSTSYLLLIYLHCYYYFIIIIYSFYLPSKAKFIKHTHTQKEKWFWMDLFLPFLFSLFNDVVVHNTVYFFLLPVHRCYPILFITCISS